MGIPIVGDMFSGEEVDAYEPDKENYTYGAAGAGRGSWERSADAQGREAAQADYGNADQARGYGQQSRDQMGQHISQLQGTAQDASSSVAAQQFAVDRSKAMGDAMAMARSGRGGNMALAQRQGLQTGGTMTQQAAGQAAVLRAQEQNAARMQIGQLLAQQRAQDLQMQGLDAQQAQAQAQLEMQQRQLNDSTALGWGGLGHQQSMGAMQGTMGYDAARGGYDMQAQMANQQADTQRDGMMMGAAAGAATGGLGALGGGGPKP